MRVRMWDDNRVLLLASQVTAGLDRAALTGFNRALAHASARLGEKAGNLPQYASTGGPVSIAGEQYFDIVLVESGKPLSVKNSASGQRPTISFSSASS